MWWISDKGFGNNSWHTEKLHQNNPWGRSPSTHKYPLSVLVHLPTASPSHAQHYFHPVPSVYVTLSFRGTGKRRRKEKIGVIGTKQQTQIFWKEEILWTTFNMHVERPGGRGEEPPSSLASLSPTLPLPWRLGPPRQASNLPHPVSSGGEGRGRDRWGVWDWHVHTAIFKIDNQQRQHRELCSLFSNNWNGKRIWKRIDTHIRITESLCCTPETNNTVNQICSNKK